MDDVTLAPCGGRNHFAAQKHLLAKPTSRNMLMSVGEVREPGGGY